MNDSREELRRMELDQFKRDHPNVPEYAIPKAKKSASASNDLTRKIIKHLTLIGGWATRINTTGRVLNGKYIPGSTKLGTFDVIGCYKGLFIGVEIKIGKDKLSEHQIQVHSDVVRAGGIAIVAHTFDEYYEHINKI